MGVAVLRVDNEVPQLPQAWSEFFDNTHTSIYRVFVSLFIKNTQNVCGAKVGEIIARSLFIF